MKVLDLFSGIGGFSLGLERAGMETVAFCEIDPFCRKVLNKHWPNVPIYEDVRELDGKQFRGTVNLVCGGYPCQAESLAGYRNGEEDDRWLWPEMYRVIGDSKPEWVIAENVAGHVSMGLDQVLSDLETANYAWWTFIIPACAIGGHHRRDRVWIVANSDSERLQKRFMQSGIQREAGQYDYGENAPLGGSRFARPELVRRFHGIPNRVDRIRGLGNSVVPQIPEIIGRAIMESITPKS